MKLLLDMDGVITNFIPAICKLHNKSNPYDDPKNLGNYDLAAMLGMTSEKFLEPTNDTEWWYDLEPTIDFESIMELIYKYFKPNDICILSNIPLNAPFAYVGKYLWCKKHLPSIKHILLGTTKEFCACSDSVLLDDDDFKVDKFRMAGGRAVLIPRPWNRLFNHSGELDTVHITFDAMFLPSPTVYD
ncbi:MAG: hypothetical protein QQN63_04600 [Nitrosopumilus sp.]